ncbi:MAG TPA: glutathione peroxidase, partial [Flavobacterium sp.]
MKTHIIKIFVVILLTGINANAQQLSEKTKNSKSMSASIYDYKVTDLTGNEFDFASLKGKKILIVNTASKCGLTPQYIELEKLYKSYQGTGLVVVGFPANNFGAQEPGTNDEIASFCQMNYGVTFPMMGKISVKGDDMHPIYKFLTRK